MSAPRVLFLDIETAPNLSWVWGKWEQNVIDVHTHWYMLSFAWKWKDGGGVKCLALPDFPPLYSKDKENDSELLKQLWFLLDGADVIIAHNADAFDIKKTTARFLYHKMKPPSPFKTIDTLKMARRYFRMDSNKLDDLGSYLRLGRKLPHTGKNLWFGCMAGKPSAWKMMKRYNRHDVALLEAVYERLKPWAANHPDLGIYASQPRPACPTCQSSSVWARGVYYAKKLRYKQWVCKACGHWFHGERLNWFHGERLK